MKTIKKKSSVGAKRLTKDRVKANTPSGKLQKHIKVPQILSLKLKVISARYGVGISEAFENMLNGKPFTRPSITEKEMVTLNLKLDIMNKLVDVAEERGISVTSAIINFIDEWQPKK